MRMKKDSGIGYVVLIVIILVLGFKLSQSYEDAKLDDVKVLDYVKKNISFYEVCRCYDESKIKEYISDKYIPTDIWSNIDVLQDYSWFELMDYGKRDSCGQTLTEYLDEMNFANSIDKEHGTEYQEWSEDGRWIKRQQG